MATQYVWKELSSMARVFQANTGKLPTTVKELADWYKMGHEHTPESIRLFQIAERPGADVLLTLALRPLRRGAATAAFPAPGGHFPEKAIVQAQAESVDDAG